jgi:hypothetical protein
MSIPFDSLSDPIVIQAYEEMDNYIIEKVSEKKLAVIYCSSNGIYSPNEYEIFKKYMYDRNKFEWLKRDWKIENAGLNIYIRDVFKQWHLKGINKEINSIDKLIQFIKEKTVGYEIVTIGSSAGGYIATVLGCKLNAKYVLNFAGQFDLNTQHSRNTLVHDYIDEDNKYTQLKYLIESSNTNVFYFVGNNSGVDSRDIQVVNSIKKNIFLFKYNQSIHGIPFENGCLRVLIQLSQNQLLELYHKYKGTVINRYFFEVYLIGMKNFVNIYTKKIKNKILRS